MDAGALGRGFVVGLAVAAPVGPIGVLVIRRSLAEGRLLGLATGLGAALADAVFALIAGLGIHGLATAMMAHADVLRIAGALMLAVLAIRTMRARPVLETTPSEGASARASSITLARAFGSTFALTLTNPMTIASFAAIAASVGLGDPDRGALGAVMLAAGVLAGSALWWVILSGGVSMFRGRIDRSRLTLVDRIAGIVLLAFAALALLG